MIRFAAAGLLLLAATAAHAQSRMTVDPNGPARTVRVQVNVNYTVPAPAGDSDDVLKAQESARRTLYGVANHECKVLMETLASECRLENVSVNVNRQRHPTLDNITAAGSFTFRVELK